MILTCTCKHEFQDSEYGPSQRVHNYAPKAYRGNAGWRCTVCGDVKETTTLTPTRKLDAKDNQDRL